MDVGEQIKNSWASPASEPPVPHAEEWTVAKAAESTNQPVEQVVANLEKAGFTVDDPAATTLKEVASRAGAVPQQVYQAATGAGTAPRMGVGEGGGWGRRTVAQVAEQAELPVATALERLKERGVTTARSDSNLRELAQAAGLTPLDVATIIQGPKAPLK